MPPISPRGRPRRRSRACSERWSFSQRHRICRPHRSGGGTARHQRIDHRCKLSRMAHQRYVRASKMCGGRKLSIASVLALCVMYISNASIINKAAAQSISEKEAAYQAVAILGVYQEKCGQLTQRQSRTVTYLIREFSIDRRSDRFLDIIRKIASSGELNNIRRWCIDVENKLP